MAEYIERKTAKDELLSWAVCINHPEHLMREDAMHVLDSIPAADVAQVRHGRWEDKPTGAYRRWQSWCSVCGKHSGIGGIESNRHKPYCPNCGAKMDGDADA